jgi:hypothetical protein
MDNTRTENTGPDSSVAQGKWWRFSQYEIADGMIRPARNANLEAYNPWQAWRDVVAKSGTNKRNELCVSSLVNVVQTLGYHSINPQDHADPKNLSRDQEEVLLQWVSENGLLGLLPHRVEYVRLAARWRMGDLIALNEETGASHPVPVTQPAHQWYARGPRDWKPGWSSAKLAPSVKIHYAYRKDLDGKLTADDELRESSRGGLVHIRNLVAVEPHLRVRFESLSKTWARYFNLDASDSPEHYPYPQPLTEDFWRLYQEPVDEFLNAAALLAEAVERLAEEQGRRADVLWLSKSEANQLNALAAPVQPEIIVTNDHKLEMTWAFPSLLSALAMITIQQLTENEGQFVRLCERCRLPFVTGDDRAAYCGAKCRQTMQKRKRRASLKKELG